MKKNRALLTVLALALVMVVGPMNIRAQGLPTKADASKCVGAEKTEILYAITNDGKITKISNEPSQDTIITVDENGNCSWAIPPYEGTGLIKPASSVSLGDSGLPTNNNDPGVERIIGTDDRIKITSTTTFPYSAVVEIRSSIGNCTGFLYDDNHVATAGHCIYDDNWATNVVVTPGKNGSSNPYGTCGALSLISNSNWVPGEDDRYDYGAIKLNCTIGTTTGWFGYEWRSLSWTGTGTYLTAYHSDKDSHTTQWRTNKNITQDSDRRLWYQHDTTGGASGAPVYLTTRNSAIAINTGESDPPTDNSGVEINQTVYNFLNANR